MNFLLRSSTQNSTASADTFVASDIDRDYRTEHSGSFHSLQSLSLGDVGNVDDFKGAGEFGSLWTRLAIEDHYDFPPDEGSILVPFRDLPENWSSVPDMADLKFLDRDFVFPGEQFHILVHVMAQDPSVPAILNPLKVADMGQIAAWNAKGGISQAPTAGNEVHNAVNGNIEVAEDVEGEFGAVHAVVGKNEHSADLSGGVDSNGVNTLEGVKRRDLKLLESFQKSHFFVRIMGEDEPLGKRREVATSGPSLSGNERRHLNGKAGAQGGAPVSMEQGKFDPHLAGGLARNIVACTSLANGDIVVLLQVTMVADCESHDAFLEVLQFERYEPSGSGFENSGQSLLKRGSWDPTQGLLQWLLPLDRPASPPPPAFVSSIANSPTKGAVTSGSNSTRFSFGQLRSASSGSLAAVAIPPVPLPAPTYTPPTYGAKEWDSAFQDRSTKTEVGSEGLLSFRGAVLEPQRFSAHCGLEGSHVPGKRWRRKLSIIHPVKLDSYFTHCNTQDLICVLVENVLPPTGRTAEVVIYVDSVNIVCQSAASGSPPLPVPVACVEVGEDYQLPGLPLRVGEQHSFILRPTSPAWKASPLYDGKKSRVGSGHELQLFGASSSQKSQASKEPSVSLHEAGRYAVIVSCHCSHSESRLHYKHSLQWRPRPPRDLLLSVSLESPTSTDSSNENQLMLKPQIVTVQATNLTSHDMNLTLLAPSTLANSPLSMVSFPAPMIDSPVTSFNKQNSFSLQDRGGQDEKEKANSSPRSPDLSSNTAEAMDLPPVRRMESVIGMSPTILKERHISAADIVADNIPARSHLWLQSTVPLGCVPAHSTTTVKCDILPLTDGIMTLDTLYISTNERDALYIPESPLQIYSTSSIASGVA